MVSFFPSFRVILQTVVLLCVLIAPLAAQIPRPTLVHFGSPLTQTKSDRAQSVGLGGYGRWLLDGSSFRFFIGVSAAPYGVGNGEMFTIEISGDGFALSFPSTAVQTEFPRPVSPGGGVRRYGSSFFQGETNVTDIIAAALKRGTSTVRIYNAVQEWSGSLSKIPFRPDDVFSLLPGEPFSPASRSDTVAIYEGTISQGSTGGPDGSHRRNATVRIVAGVDAAAPADGVVHLTVRRIESRGTPGREQVIYQTRSESWTRADAGRRSFFQAATGDETDEGTVSELLIGRSVAETAKAVVGANVWPGKIALTSQRWIGLTGTTPLSASRRSVESAGLLKLNRAATAKAQQAGETVDQTFTRMLSDLTVAK